MGLSSLVTAAQSAAAAYSTPEDREHLLDTAHKLSIAAVHVLNTVQELKNKDKLYERGGAGLGAWGMTEKARGVRTYVRTYM